MNGRWISLLLLFGSLLCCVGCADGKDMLLSTYEKMISSFGNFQRTDGFLLWGIREDGADVYTGTYTATCKKTRAKDVVFGGCSIESRDLSITGTVGAQDGMVEIYVWNGSEEKQYFTPDADGTFSGTVHSNGGDCYLVVDYADFTGKVALQSSYIKQ